MSAATTDRILASLRDRGARVTPVRRAVIVALSRARSHLNAEAIAASVQAEHPDVHVSTIYRNLDVLEQLGIIEHTHLGHRPAVYHLEPDHQHLVCEVCNRVIDVPVEILDDLAGALRRTYGFTLHPGHFAVMGKCRKHGA